jgi:hypothetical protein
MLDVPLRWKMENYNLGASYYRNQFEKGGVVIFVHKSSSTRILTLTNIVKKRI